MKILRLDQIKEILPGLNIIQAIEDGFAAYSQGRAVVPPVGELSFADPPGDVHIKYGYISGGDHYVVKIASGFYDNPKRGLPSGDGLMLLYKQETGKLAAILLDEAYLTDVRTAVAGAIAARHLAPRHVRRIGIVGTGVQARLQLQYLRDRTPCRDAIVWGRSQDKLDLYQQEMAPLGFAIQTTRSIGELADTCNLIVTVTAATRPLLVADQIREGTHITAVGSDTIDKQELDAAILAKADLVVADSLSQCLLRGEIAHALKAGLIRREEIAELGDLIAGKAKGRTREDQISVADLTGVAVQDIKIAEAVFQASESMSR